MKAIGILETRGLIPAIEGTDAMLKSANVKLVNRYFVKGGIVTIIIEGDVGAVKAATDAGAAAAEKIGELRSIHVIARPHEEIDKTIIESIYSKADNETNNQDYIESEFSEEIVEDNKVEEEGTDKLEKQHIDMIYAENGLDEVLSVIEARKVVDLRKLARQYEDFSIAGRVVSKADKETLIKSFVTYYKNKTNE